MVKLLSISIDAPGRPVDIGSETQRRVADQDLFGTALQETRPVVPNPFEAEPPVDVACDRLNPTSRKFEAERPAPLLSTLSIETAIRLRWVLRDIKGNRTKLSPVSPEDLKTLIDTGLVKMCGDVPVITANGCTEID